MGAVAAPVLLIVGLSAAPAEAAVTTSTGVRCTVVGTAGGDVLRGTPRRDVICGRAGNDVIRGRGGDDLIDAGSGADRVFAGAGDDRVLAGHGKDRVNGGDGKDRISGGGGSDVLDGNSGSDRLSGGHGADLLRGDAGVDTLSGGAGDDTINGGGSNDSLYGRAGNDRLTGDGGADHLDGGAGTNVCVIDAADKAIRCMYDQSPPVMVEARIDPASVDVSGASAVVNVTVRATDDTGVDFVHVNLYNERSGVGLAGSTDQFAGSARDGWWRSTFVIARWTPPGDLQALVTLRDRLGRQTDLAVPIRLHVVDTNPDIEKPELTLLAPLGQAPVDVRSHAADVTVSVRATDNLSGVGRVDLCLARPDKPLFTGVVCEAAVPMASGTALDGVWTAVLPIPKGSAGGDWNVLAHASDHTGVQGAFWMGPEAYRQYIDTHTAGYEPRAFPDGAGRLTVIGVSDSTPAWTDSVTLTPTVVDTFTADATTHVSVHALDAAGEGVTQVTAVLVDDSNLNTGPTFPRVELDKTAGTPQDGTWSGDLTLTRGTPPGTYHVIVFVTDPTHSRGYVGSGSPYASGYGYEVLGDPHVDVVAHP